MNSNSTIDYLIGIKQTNLLSKQLENKNCTYSNLKTVYTPVNYNSVLNNLVVELNNSNFNQLKSLVDQLKIVYSFMNEYNLEKIIQYTLGAFKEISTKSVNDIINFCEACKLYQLSIKCISEKNTSKKFL